MKVELSETGNLVLTTEDALDREKVRLGADGKTFTKFSGHNGDGTITVWFSPQGSDRAEPLPTSILSDVHQELSHIPSQRQATKVASYYRELLKNRLPSELIEQLTLDFQSREMDNA